MLATSHVDTAKDVASYVSTYGKWLLSSVCMQSFSIQITEAGSLLSCNQERSKEVSGSAATPNPAGKNFKHHAEDISKAEAGIAALRAEDSILFVILQREFGERIWIWILIPSEASARGARQWVRDN